MKGYLAAQRAYDAQSPPEFREVDCPSCGGEEAELMSDCCGAAPLGETHTFEGLVTGLCRQCRDHCSFPPCDECKGNLKVEISEEDFQKRKARARREAQAEARAEDATG